MMGHVFVEIGKNQKQFEHPVALLRIRVSGAFFQIIHDRQRISEQPFQPFRVDWLTRVAALKSAVRPRERFVQKVVQAQPLRG